MAEMPSTKENIKFFLPFLGVIILLALAVRVYDQFTKDKTNL